MSAVEINFDAIVGPTHNYAGLAYGNVASQKNRQSASSPKQAALEGLAKMKAVADLGVPQAVLPPPVRPDIATLRAAGYAGSDADVLATVSKDDPILLAAVSSASAMWAANTATVSPSADAPDGRVHFTPANLISQLHRSIEPASTATILRAIFPDAKHFTHHPPLPCQLRWADEGAANHTRLCLDYDQPGVELFVYGRHVDAADPAPPKKFPARQTAEASRAVARLHGLDSARTLFVQQNPDAIDAGVFHNDVAAVGNRNVFLCHARAFVDQPRVIEQLKSIFAATTGQPLHVIEIGDDQLTLDEAVDTYLFNSQIVAVPDGTMALIAPPECRDHPRARHAIVRIVSAGTPIKAAHFVDVRQSMRNGGGPACLRLRVVLTDAERAATHPGVFLTDALYDRLTDWVTRHYRDRLHTGDLADPGLLEESRTAITKLHQILGLPPIS
jgi:succinylarginine dihydrolase